MSRGTAPGPLQLLSTWPQVRVLPGAHTAAELQVHRDQSPWTPSTAAQTPDNWNPMREAWDGLIRDFVRHLKGTNRSGEHRTDLPTRGCGTRAVPRAVWRARSPRQAHPPATSRPT